MKRIGKAIAGATLALSLLAGSAANAAPAHRGNGGSNDGAAIALGVGLFALVAVLASQNNHDNDRGYVRVDDRRDGWRGDRGYHRDTYQRGYRYDRNNRW